jgi:hypothetical protein
MYGCPTSALQRVLQLGIDDKDRLSPLEDGTIPGATVGSIALRKRGRYGRLAPDARTDAFHSRAEVVGSNS